MSLVIDKIRKAGIVGCGGAGFPTHFKLDAKAEILIANGAECEPLLECDRHLMLTHPREILEGMRIAMKAVGAREGILAFKDKHHDLPGVFEPILKDFPRIRIGLLPDVYPMGDEQVLLYEMTGRMVPPGGLPLRVGIVIQNVHTLRQIYLAQSGEAVIHRWLTVGGLVARPTTFVAPIGTPVGDLIAAAGGLTRNDATLINGGPMTGSVIESLDDIVTKTMGGILALPPDNMISVEKTMPIEHHYLQSRFTCFQCQDCTRVCPRFLLGFPFQPHMVMRAINYPSDLAEPILQTAHYCCDCGLCSLIGCQTMNLSPRKVCCDLKGKVDRPSADPAWLGSPNPMREDVAIPSKRILRRHGLDPYHVHTELVEAPLAPTSVTISLRQHIGKASIATVKTGDKVQAGQMIGEPDGTGITASVHASIDGTVVEVTKMAVKISR